MEEIDLPKLRVIRKEAKDKIQAQIVKGELLRDRQICSEDELDKSGIEANNWSKYNRDLLLKLFDNLSEDEYKDFHYYRLSYQEMEDRLNVGLPTDWEYRVDEEYQRNMDDSINSLKGICDRLELFNEVLDRAPHTLDNKEFPDNSTRTFGDDVFIVHGHDEAAKHAIAARFVEKFNLKATILDEQASKGQTVIDKFEENADKVGFAIVLLTPDDVGALKNKTDELNPRARQNVILELGYFWGRLERKRVCVLYKEGVELPSDIQGIVYVPMDNPNAWQLPLAKEMQQVGLPIDLNQLVLGS